MRWARGGRSCWWPPGCGFSDRATSGYAKHLMARPLLVVDVQNGFINDFTHHIPERIAQLIETKAFGPVLFTRFVNEAGSPYQRLLDWHGSAEPPETELVPELERFVSDGNVYVK